jgi:hypothetical protein
VPKYQLFLDGTAEFHGSGELPADDRGAEVLVVEPGGESHFFRTPEADPKDNAEEYHYAAKLLPDGSASVQVKETARGSWTAELRRIYEPADERKNRAEEHLARAAFPNVKVTAVEVSDPHEIEKPFETRFTASAPGFASAFPGGLKFSPFGQRQSFVEAYAQLSRRSLPEELPVPQTTVIESDVELPQGWTATVPEGAGEAGASGSWKVSYTKDGGKVHARLELTLKGGQLQPTDYAAFRAFLGRLDDALQRKVEAGPGPRTAMK